MTGNTADKVLRWLGILLGGLAGLAIIAYAVLYLLSERILHRTYEVPTVALAVPEDAPSIAEGRRLAILYGCFDGCHGKGAGGGVLFDQPVIARIVAPDLTASVNHYSDGQLAVIVRRGLRPDGHSLAAMPSESFAPMTDTDLGRIIAFLRSLPPVAGPGPGLSLGPLGRIGLLSGKIRTTAQLVADTVPPPEARTPEGAFGRYLARTVCAHCHGTALRGDSNPDFTSPDLRIVTAYSPEAFTALLRRGVPLGGQDLPVMGPWARQNLSQLADAEIAALYRYLHTENVQN